MKYPKFLCVLALTIAISLGISTVAVGQALTGTKTIATSGGDYTSIAAAITDLNSKGVGTGGVTFNIPAGFTEPALSTTLKLTATGTATNPIVFQKSGAGANPLITAYTGGVGTPATANQDGIWRLEGSDYVTIDGIDLIENAANTTNPSTMEYGYALYKASTSNGCQNNTIKNCTITLNRVNNATGTAPMTDGSAGIIVMNAIPTAATTPLTPTATAASANANNKFYKNTIQNVNVGISMVGYAAGSLAVTSDVSNDIGGSSAATGNTIQNFGGGGVTTAANGIVATNQYELNVSFNTIVNNVSSGGTNANINHGTTLRGLFIGSAAGINATINSNTITVTGGGTTTNTEGIEFTTTAASNTVSISNNIISGSYNTATTGNFYGIYNTAAPTTLTINNNTISNSSYISNGNATGVFTTIFSTGACGTLNITNNTITRDSVINGASATAFTPKFYAIYNSGTVTTAVNINTNNIGTASIPIAVFSGATGNAGNHIFINNTGGAAASVVSISNNNIYTPNYATAGSGSNTLISNSAVCTTQNINSNIFGYTTSSTGTTGALTFMTSTPVLTSGGTQNVNSNSITGTYTKAAGALTLFSISGTSITNTTLNNNNNNFTNIAETGTATIAGWVITDAGAGTHFTQNNTFANWTGVSTITALNTNITSTNNSTSGNLINNLSSAGAVTGIITAAGNDNIFSNTINTLSTTGAFITSAIAVSAGTTKSIYKNKIYDLLSNNAGGSVFAISLSGGTTGAVTTKVYNNLIGDLRAPITNLATDAIRGISITDTKTNSTLSIYYNTIYINATSSGTNFFTTGVYHTSAAATTALLDMQNNIISNTSIPNGTGTTVAYKRSATGFINYAGTSGSNLFFAGPQSATRLIFADGTAADNCQTLAAYKTLANTAATTTKPDQASVSEDLVTTAKFLSVTGSSATFLHIDPTQPTQVESGGQSISAAYTTDYDGQLRADDPGYTDTGTDPDIGADEFSGTTLILAGTVNVGTGQTYTSLTGATGLFAAINTIGLTDNLSVKITSDLTEDGTNALYQWGETGTGNYTVTIQPSANAARLISGNVVAGLIRFNGADRVIIDGGNGGTTTNYLTFRNTNTAISTGTAITFLNGATNNVIKYTNIEAAANATNGVILFSTNTTTVTDGNSLNQISYCNINATVGGISGLAAIYSLGTVGKENTTNTFTSNNIYNFVQRGIDITATGTTAWKIISNSFYNGDITSGVNYNTINMIGIRALGGAGYTITGNYIGGNAALAGGTTAAYASSTSGMDFIGIQLTTSSATPVSNIKGNTLAKISVTALPPAASTVLFQGILTAGSGINIGGSTAGDGNMIGSNTANGAIAINTTTTTVTFTSIIRGIDCGSTGGAILGNQIGGFDINNQGTTAAVSAASTLTAINVANATAPATINNNIIGSNGAGAATNSNRIVAASTALASGITGISLGTATNSVQIDGNLIQNNSILSTTLLTGGGIIGISNGAVAAALTSISITNNTFNANSINLYSGSFVGFTNGANASTVNINNNTVSNNTTNSAAGVFNAITNTGTVTVGININANNIGTSTAPPITFTAANSGAQVLISNTKAGAASALSISNNNFYSSTYSFTTGGTGANTYVSVAGTPLTQAINGNTFNNLNINTSGGITFFTNSVVIPTTGTLNINNNSIVTGFTKRAATSTVTFISGTGASAANTTTTANYNGNNFSNVTLTGAVTVVGITVTDAGTGTGVITKNIQSNTFTNWSCGTAAVTVITSNVTSPVNNVNGNIINNITNGSTIIGITTSAGSNNIYKNIINTITGSAAAAVSAISVTAGATQTVYKNKIYDINSSNAGGTVNGILVSGGTAVTVYDNLVGDLKIPTGTGAADIIKGISVTSTTVTSAVNLYYNTVYLSATSSGANFSTSAISATNNAVSTTAALTMINNSFSNLSTATGTGKTVAYRRSGAGFTNYASGSDNNLYYGNTASAANLIFYDGTTSAQTLAIYQALVTTKDQAAVSENLTSKFLSITGSSGLYLHLSAVIANVVQNAGKFVPAITDDYDDQPRATSPGPPNPDIGADEVTGIETTPPVITYTVLANTTLTSNVTLSNVTITDGSGVNTTAGTKPRIYYKRLSDANTVADNTSSTNGWKYTEATNSVSPFSFTIDYSLLYGGTAVVAGPIQYFVTAQDLAAVANVGINSGVFNTTPASVALTSSAFPITGTINAYNVPFNGSYNVGTGQVFTSLTKSDGIFSAMNTAGFSGSVTVNITSNTTEDGTTALNQWTEFGTGSYTLTVQPDATTLRVLSGSASNGLVRLNGVNRTTFDGTTSASLQFKNTNTSGTGTAFTFINGASNNTLRYLEADAFGNATNGVILFSTSSGATGNNNNLIDNVTMNGTVSGNTSTVDIYSAGTAGKENTGNTVSNCDLQNFGYRAIDIAANSNTWTISTNDIYNGSVTGSINYPASSTLYGVRIATGSGHTILNNNIGGTTAGTGGANAVFSSNLGDLFYAGISLTTTSATPASSIKGNKISAISVSSVPTVASSSLFTGIETFGSGITVGGSTSAEGNIVGSKTANSAIVLSTSTTNAANTSTIIGINYSSAGNTVNYNNVGGFDISNIGSAPAGSALTGIAVNNASAPTQVNNNIVGSASLVSSIRVLAASTATNTSLTGINIGSAVNSAMQINSNQIDNIGNLSTTSSGTFTGINNASTNSGAVLTMQTDTIQNISAVANASTSSGVFTGIFTASQSTINNNLIKSISLPSTGINAQIQAINVGGGYAQTVTNNTISTLSTASKKENTSAETGSPTLSAIAGILNSATVAGQVISGNTLSGLGVSGTTAINPTVTGIGVTGNSSGNIFNNKVGTLTNTTTGTNPGLIGIMAASGTFNAYNNVVRMGNSTNTNGVRLYGIIHAAGANWNYFYNSVQIQGSSTSSLRTAAFIAPVAGSLVVKNNNLLNIRTGSGANYAVSNPVAPPGTSWTSSTSDYNNYYSVTAANTAEWGAGVAQTFAQWKTSSSGDAHSVNSSFTLVTAAGELRPDTTTNCSLNNSAIPITTPIAITKDINNVTRSSSTPDIGAYEFTYTAFIITPGSSIATVCTGSSVTLTVDPGTAATPTYQWRDPSGTLVSTLQNPTVTAVAGTYTVTVFDVNGCSVTGNVPIALNPRPTAHLTGAAQTCQGSSTNLTLTVTGTGTFIGTLNDGTPFSGTAPSFTVSVAPAITTKYYISTMSDDLCTSIRADIPDSVTVTALHQGDWTGLVSTDWNNTGNWCGGVPTTSVNVDIRAGTPFYPVLTAGIYSNANIIIETGASVTINGGTLQISGTITNTGTFTATGGTVELNGSSAQSIPASTFASNSVNNLKTNNTAGIVLNGPLKVIGVLTPSAGAFSSNGNITLVSSATQTALIDGSGAGTVTGSVTMQRYLASGFGYKYFSSPVQGATVGNFSSIVDLGASFANFFQYIESNTTSGFTSYTTTTNPLTVFKGYAIDFGPTTNPVTVSLSGAVNNGTLSTTILNTNKTYTLGFNLVGNPYPSPINWDAATGWTKTNIDNAIYYFDSGTTSQYTGTYSTYINGVSSDGVANNILASMQGFFVHVSNGSFPVTGTLGVTNAVRVNNLSPVFHKSNSIGGDQFVRMLVRLSASYAGDAKSSDPIVVYTDAAASKVFNNKVDAVKLLNTNDLVPNLYMFGPDKTQLAIGALTTIDSNTVVPLSLHLAKSGQLNFNLLAADNLPFGLKGVYLNDKKTRRVIQLFTGSGTNITLDAGDYDNRFYLEFNDTEDPLPPVDTYYAYRQDGKVYVNIKLMNERPGKLSLLSISGNTVFKQQVSGNGIYDLGHPKTMGIYVVSFVTSNGVFARKIFVPE